ncbi:MAG: DUF3352 domain-containing protein [Chloroflexota bacterium]
MTEQNEITSNTEAQNALGRIGRLFIPIALIMGIISILPRLFGANLDPIAASMPPDTLFYMEINGLNLLSQDSLRIAESFQEIMDEADFDFDSEDPNLALEEIEQQFFEDTGLSIQEDILSWVGPNFGVALMGLEQEFVDFGEVPDIILGVSVLNQNEADAFIPKMIELVGEESEVTESEYQGVRIYTAVDNFGDAVSFARTAEVMVITPQEALIQAVVEAQNGESLASTDLYKDTIAQLPEERIMTFFMAGAGYDNFLSIMEADPTLPGFQADALAQLLFDSIGMSISTNAHGIQIDTKTIYSDMSEAQRAYLEANTGEMASAKLLPESTMMLISGQRLDLYWAFMQENFDAMGLPAGDIDEAMNLFEAEFGFNPIEDLIPILDGEYAIALTESNEGQISASMGVNMGAMLLLETSESNAMRSLVEDINDTIFGLIMIQPQLISHPDAAVYEISNPFLGGQIAAYGVSDSHFILSTSDGEISQLLSDKSSLADSAVFQETWAAFPETNKPVLYMNVGEMFGMLTGLDPDLDNAARLNPVSIVAAGNQFENDVVGSTVIIFIP